MKDRIEDFNRREFVGVAFAGSAALASHPYAKRPAYADTASDRTHRCQLKINGKDYSVQIDPRTTLLDLLRENLQLAGTKKGCDHGQCGACTVLLNGKRINSCLSLAVMNEGMEITTIEGLGTPAHLHPMQTAFVDNDALQCGYCTPGQICSAVAMLDELKQSAPSAVTVDISSQAGIELTDDEIRERMSGNICRCGAYVGIVAAIRSVAQEIPA
jgi:xanthine dehydrogenase YagT iron-sulfur-binding subunit